MNTPIWNEPAWCQSVLGKSIELYASEDPEKLAEKKPIIFIGGMHGDEPEGVLLAEQWLNWLKNHDSDKFKPWILVTCINPDGYQLNERTNGRGVDLNRNFPSKCWITDCEESRYYPGDSPASEPEVAALVELINKTSPSLIVHFHSWQPSIVYSNEKGKWAAKLLAQCSGYELQPDIGYPTQGSLGEYGANDLDIQVICIEELEGQKLATIFPRFKQGLIEIVSSKT
ncbi:murein peptide amidase A [Thalassotalea sp. M1531]|uniref:Murein peptide amidase A n=1 Tax=Thalassotalea algicola TaxID=2716224 RepID=A0A7Y0Q6U0_9GAMM|nr:murein peptide amidase A [Thalassotalea algicola]